MRTILLAISLLLSGSILFGQVDQLRAIPYAPYQVQDELRAGKAGGAVERATVFGVTDKVFPHLAIGGGWETTLVLVNLGSTRIEYTQTFRDQSGGPLSVTFRSIPEGQITTASAIAGSIGPGSSFNILLTDPGSAVKVGWSIIDYDATSARIGGYAIFRARVAGRPDFEALVPLSGFDDSVFVMPYDNLEGFVTSMAILNPGANFTTDVRATIRDGAGNVLGTSTISLAPGRHTAFVIPDQFTVTRNRVGTIQFEGTTTRLAALGFRFNPQGAFATIPIMNWIP